MITTEKRNKRILVIDDNEAIHKDFKSVLCNSKKVNDTLSEAKAAIFGEEENTEAAKMVDLSFEIDSAFQGKAGMEMVLKAEKENRPYVMAFVDVRMPPGWDGIETIKRIWEKVPTLQVVVCTAYSDYSWSEMIDQLGQTDRLLILKKPFDNIEVRQIVCSLTEKWHLLNDLESVVQKRTQEIAETRDIAVFAIANLAESRDPETGDHLERIRSYCSILAKYLSKEGPYTNQIDETFIDEIYRSSPLHDIGKVGIPDKILLKPGSLEFSEFEIMKEHAALGADALEKAIQGISSGGFLAMAVDIARHHHEKFNGKGYPDKLKGTDIPLAARITTLADVYDALTSVRVYKPAFRPEVAKIMILEEKGEHFDPILVDAFMTNIEEFHKVHNLLHGKDLDLVETNSNVIAK